jgi:hypothetical protein
MKTITLQNSVQSLLWVGELSGQVSDGFWENSKPYDHYKAVSGARVNVDPDAEPSINFYLRRRYNFANTTLFKYVGARMQMSVLVLKTFPTLSLEAIRCFDNGSYMWGNAHYEKTLAEFASIGIHSYDDLQRTIKNLDSTLYTIKDLKKDLKVITNAFNNFKP